MYSARNAALAAEVRFLFRKALFQHLLNGPAYSLVKLTHYRI